MADSGIQKSEAGGGQVLLAGVVVVAVVAFFVLQRPPGPPAPPAVPSSRAVVATGSAKPPRCQVVQPGSVVGDTKGKAEAVAEDDRLAPYAAELGRAVATATGYVVGVKRYRKDRAEVGFMHLDERGVGTFQSLGRSRADLGAPTVTAAGQQVWAATVEPNAAGVGLRVVRTAAKGKPSWGMEVQLERGEFQDYDVTVAADQGWLAYTELGRGKKTSYQVMLQGFAASSLKKAGKARVRSRTAIDAEAPRLLVRPGGLWLAYVARSRLDLPKKPGDKALGRSPKQERFAAEKIEPSWLEVVPLDGAGNPLGEARPITSQSGHVLAFDVAVQGDALLLAWRDDDTPSGAGSGRVFMQRVRVGAEGSSQLVAETDVGSGVPLLVGNWLALPDRRGRMRLAPIDSSEDAGSFLKDELRIEANFGMAQPLAAGAGGLLLAQPRGREIRFAVGRCQAKP